MDTAIRTLRLETSTRGRPNTPRFPSSAGSSQKDLDAPIPKELCLPSLEGGRLGERSPKWRWLKDKEGESPTKQNRGRSKEGLRTRVRTAGRTALLTKPNLHRAGLGGRKKRKKRSQRALSLSLSLSLWSTLLFGSLDRRALMPQRWIFLLSSK